MRICRWPPSESSGGGPELACRGCNAQVDEGIAEFQPGRSFGTGLALGSVNPKNVIVGLAAAATIASEAGSRGQQIGAIAIYVLVAVLGVAAPIVVTAFLGDRSPKVLGRVEGRADAEQCDRHVGLVS